MNVVVVAGMNVAVIVVGSARVGGAHCGKAEHDYRGACHRVENLRHYESPFVVRSDNYRPESAEQRIRLSD
jgi:hypothetical protein